MEEQFYDKEYPAEPVGPDALAGLLMSVLGAMLLLVCTPFYFWLGIVFMFMVTGPWLVRLAKAI